MPVSAIRFSPTRFPFLVLLFAGLLIFPGSRLAAESLEDFLRPSVLADLERAKQELAGKPPLTREALLEIEEDLNPWNLLAASEPLLLAAPQDEAIHVARAKAWRNLSQFQRALDEVQSIPSASDFALVAAFTRGMSLRARGHLEPAVVQLQLIPSGTYWSVYADEPLEEMQAQAEAWEKSLRPFVLRPKAPVPPAAFAVARATGATDLAFALVRAQLEIAPADPEALKTVTWVCLNGGGQIKHRELLAKTFAPQLAAAARLNPTDADAWDVAVRAGADNVSPGDSAGLAAQSALLADAAKAGRNYPVEQLQLELFAVRDQAALNALEPRVKKLTDESLNPKIHWNRMLLFLSPAGPSLEQAVKDPANAAAWAAALAATRTEVIAGHLAPAIYDSMHTIATNAGHTFPVEQPHAALIAKTDPLELIAAIRDALPQAATDPELRRTIDGLTALRLQLEPGHVGVTRALRIDTAPRFTEEIDLTTDEAAALTALPTPLERAQGFARRHAPAAALAALGAETASEDYPTARLRVILLQQLGRLNEALLALDRAVLRLGKDPEAAKFPWAGLRSEFETMHRQVAKAEAEVVLWSTAANWARLTAAWTQQPCPSYPKALRAAAHTLTLDSQNREALIAETESLVDYFQGLPAPRRTQLNAQNRVTECERLMQQLYAIPGDPPFPLSVRVLRLQPAARRAQIAQDWLGPNGRNKPKDIPERPAAIAAMTFYAGTTRREMEDAELALASIPATSPYAADAALARRTVDELWAKDGLYRPETILCARNEIERRNEAARELATDIRTSVTETLAIQDPKIAANAWVELAVDAWDNYEKLRLVSLHTFEASLKALPDSADRQRMIETLAQQQPFGPPEASSEVRAGHRLAGNALTTGERAAAAECVRAVCIAYTHLNHARLATTSLKLLRGQHLRVAEVDEVQTGLARINCTGDYADFQAEFDAITNHIRAGNYASAQAEIERIAPRARGNPFYHLLSASIANDTDRPDAYRLLIAMPNDLMIVPNVKERYVWLDQIMTNRRDYVRAQRSNRQQEIRDRLATIRQELDRMNAHVEANTDRLRDVTEGLSSTSYAQLSSRQAEADRLDANTAMWTNGARRLVEEAQSIQAELARLEGR